MKRITSIFAGSLLAVSAFAIYGQGQVPPAAQGSAQDATNVKVGQPLPPFTASGIDGKKYLTSDLRNEGHPAFLYFINESDGTSRAMTSFFDRIVKAYQPGDTKVFGIINAREDKARSYQSEFQSPYQVLVDPNLSTINLLGVKSAPTVIMLDESGNVSKVWAGFSATALKEINTAMAGGAEGRAQTFDFGTAPSATKYGASYNVRKEGATGGGF